MKKYWILILLVTVLLVYCGNKEKPGEVQQAAQDAMGDKQKIQTAMLDIKAIGEAAMSYVTENYKAPEGASMQALKSALQPDYIRVLPTTDPWGNEFLYKGEGENFWIACAGPDGKFEGFEKQGDDIVYQDGSFL